MLPMVYVKLKKEVRFKSTSFVDGGSMALRVQLSRNSVSTPRPPTIVQAVAWEVKGQVRGGSALVFQLRGIARVWSFRLSANRSLERMV